MGKRNELTHRAEVVRMVGDRGVVYRIEVRGTVDPGEAPSYDCPGCGPCAEFSSVKVVGSNPVGLGVKPGSQLELTEDEVIRIEEEILGCEEDPGEPEPPMPWDE
jgi:hypothetical protein